MSRIQACFDRLSQRGVKALVPFITAGDPEPIHTVPLMHAMVAGGADVLELGVPFSDPMADGPVIQRSSERALKFGVSLDDVLGMVRTFRESDPSTPVVLMGYLNPIETIGYSAFARRAKEAGVDGVVTVDLPPEEAEELVLVLREQAIDPIFLISPTTSEQRLKRISDMTSGYLYYVSLKGVTGSDRLDIDDVARRLGKIRQFTKLPIGVGFGIKDAGSAAQVAAISDAVVIGSALVTGLNRLASDPARMIEFSHEFIQGVRQAMDQQQVA